MTKAWGVGLGSGEDWDGYFSFGTPATIIDGGGKRNCYSGTCALDTEAIKMGGSTAISFTKGPTAPSTVLRFGFCQSFYLEQFRIKDIAAKIWLPAPPTCSDGVQNQGEAGVDCGGPCSSACIPITVDVSKSSGWAMLSEITIYDKENNDITSHGALSTFGGLSATGGTFNNCVSTWTENKCSVEPSSQFSCCTNLGVLTNGKTNYDWHSPKHISSGEGIRWTGTGAVGKVVVANGCQCPPGLCSGYIIHVRSDTTTLASATNQALPATLTLA